MPTIDHKSMRTARLLACSQRATKHREGVDISHHRHRVARAVAVMLALTAIAGQPASANSGPTTGPCSEVCSGGGYGLSRPAVAATNAGPCSEVCSGGGYDLSRPAVAATNAGPCSEVCSGGGYDLSRPAVRVPPSVVGVASGNSGFGWAEAGIGVAAAAGLFIISLAMLSGVRHRRGSAARP